MDIVRLLKPCLLEKYQVERLPYRLRDHVAKQNRGAIEQAYE